MKRFLCILLAIFVLVLPEYLFAISVSNGTYDVDVKIYHPLSGDPFQTSGGTTMFDSSGEQITSASDITVAVTYTPIKPGLVITDVVFQLADGKELQIPQARKRSANTYYGSFSRSFFSKKEIFVVLKSPSGDFPPLMFTIDFDTSTIIAAQTDSPAPASSHKSVAVPAPAPLVAAPAPQKDPIASSAPQERSSGAEAEESTLPNFPLSFIGIKKGDREANVIAIYGEPRKISRGSYGKLMFYAGDVVFCVTGDNGRVTDISLYPKGIATIRGKGTEDQLSAWVMKSREDIIAKFGPPNGNQDKLISYWNTPYGTLWFWFEGPGENLLCKNMEVRW